LWSAPHRPGAAAAPRTPSRPIAAAAFPETDGSASPKNAATAGSVDGGAQHLATAAGVDGQHADAEFRGLAHRGADSVGNVVVLQIEKYFSVGGDQVTYGLGTFGGEKLIAYFEGVNRFAQRGDNAMGFSRR